MDPYRTNRLAADIQRLLSDLIATRVKDPLVQMVSIAQVELNRDHSLARVFVVGTGDGDTGHKSLLGLRRAAGFLQRELGMGLRLRSVPALRFELDESIERGLGVAEVLRELEARGEFLDEREKRRHFCHEDLEPPPELLDPLRAAGRVWLTGHWNPDPDCTGAMLALASALRELGKDVVAFVFPDPPSGLVGLPGWNQTTPVDRAPALLAEEPPDLALLVDCHRTGRCGELQETLDRLPAVLCLDHHLVSSRRSPLPGWLDARAESTCTLAFRLIQELADHRREAIDAAVATNLFAGLAGDTGGFRFDNVMPATFRLAAELSARGADTAEIQHVLLHRRSRQGIDLLQRALAGLAYAGEGRIALLRITAAMLRECGAAMTETDGMVNLLTTIDGVRYAVVLKEHEDDVWRVSIRSRVGDAQAVAARFGGGGHRAAAGFNIEGPGDEVQARLVEALLRAE